MRYTKPTIVNIDTGFLAFGQNCQNGSGEYTWCHAGNNADLQCESNGNNAWSCTNQGIGSGW